MDEKRLFPRPAFSGTALKRIACVSMLLDHTGVSCIENRVLNHNSAWILGNLGEAFRAQPAPLVLDLLLRAVGRLAFPIYCFLLIEGFVHTYSVKRYLGRMLLFAFVSEVPFDWALLGKPFVWDYQNVFWTLFLGLLAMVLMQRADGDNPPTLRGLLPAAACAVAAEALRADYGAAGVILIVALYCLRGDRKRQCSALALLTLYEITAPLAAVLVWFYTGKRGKCGKAEKFLYYVFYPAHLILLGVIANL